jgi:hypothetical protein
MAFKESKSFNLIVRNDSKCCLIQTQQAYPLPTKAPHMRLKSKLLSHKGTRPLVLFFRGTLQPIQHRGNSATTEPLSCARPTGDARSRWPENHNIACIQTKSQRRYYSTPDCPSLIHLGRNPHHRHPLERRRYCSLRHRVSITLHVYISSVMGLPVPALDVVFGIVMPNGTPSNGGKFW